MSGSADLTYSVAQVLDAGGRTAGTAFLVTERLLVTCAHVIADGGAPPDGPVRLRFVHLDDLTRRARVDRIHWRAPDAGDVAFLHLPEPPPVLARPLPLGGSGGVRQHQVATFGFPRGAPRDGHYGYGRAGDPITGDAGGPLLQLTDCTEVTEGFSGGPVLDEVSGLVIGMVDSVAAVDRLGRGAATAYVTPTEVLRAVHPALALSDTCPYLGLRSFSRADAVWFHGRGRAVDAVLSALGRGRGFLALLGPSGSGKSSLVQAGVRPALDAGGLPGSDRWHWITARPGGDPFAQLAEAGLTGAGTDGLAAAATGWLREHPESERLVLVLDQFEEVLLATPAQARDRLLGELAALPERASAVTVVITMRDDFYSRLAAAAPGLMPLVEGALVNVPGVLGPDELAEIVERPAQAVGLALDPNLTERICRDAAQVMALVPAATRAGAPVTVLPLLSSALVELWERRDDGRLTHRAYDALGELAGWLSRWCDRMYEQARLGLSVDGQRIARSVITALVRPGSERDALPPTRQRRTLRELAAAGAAADVTAVVAALADRRLLTTTRDPATGEPVVELAHEALIHEWELLRGWLAEDHEFLAWRGDVESDRAQWSASEGLRGSPDPELLLHGSALEAAREWTDRRPLDVSLDVAEFVRLSDEAERRRLSRDRRRVAVLASLLVLAVVLGSAAWFQASSAREAARLADSQRLVAQAEALAGEQPDLGLLLALQSLHAAPSQEAWAGVARTLSQPIATSRVLYAGGASGLTALAISPDGRTLASGGQDGRLRFWDTTARPSGEQVRGESRFDSFHAIAFSPDGRLLATSTYGAGIQLWDVATRRPVATLLARTGLLGAVAFSLDGRFLAGVEHGRAHVWNVATRTPMGPPIDSRSGILQSVAFRPDGRTLVTTSDVGIVRTWDVATRQRLDQFRLPMGAKQVTYAPDGRTLAVSGEDGNLYLVGPGRVLTAALPTTARAGAFAFRPGRTTVVVADSEGVVQEWDYEREVPVGPRLRGHLGAVKSVAFTPDGRVLATAGRDGTVRLWDFTVRQPLAAPMAGHVRDVKAVAFNRDGSLLASGGFDTTTRLWDVARRRENGRPMSPHPIPDPSEVLSGDPVSEVRFAPDGRSVLSVSSEAVRRWDIGTGSATTLAARDPAAGSAGWRPLAVSPDGRRYASWDETQGGVRVWDAATRRPVTGVLEGGRTAIAAAFTHDGTRIALGNVGPVDIYEVPGGQPVSRADVGEFQSVRALAFSPDDTRLAVGSGELGRGAFLFRRDGDEMRGERLPTDDRVRAVAFSTDGRLLATAGDDQTVRLWDTSPGTRFAEPLSGHIDGVNGLAFSPDGSLLASASDDGTVRLWATPRTWVRQACEVAGRNLSRAEWDRYVRRGEYVRQCPGHPAGDGAPSDAPAADYPSAPGG